MTKLLLLFLPAILVAACWPSGADATRSTRVTENSDRTVDSDDSLENPPGSFWDNLPSGFAKPTDRVGKLIMAEYGAVYISRGVNVGSKIGFSNETEVQQFQTAAKFIAGNVGNRSIELQEPAMAALQRAVIDLRAARLSITPRSTNPARRSYQQTVANWRKNVNAGLANWGGKGRISAAERTRIQNMELNQQIVEILNLEQDRQLYFSTWFDKTIIYSVAPPGMSQHNLMLALDIVEFGNPRVREILARHGWHRTIPSDEPHFTYLGITTDADLTAAGLKRKLLKPNDPANAGFWVPDI